MKIYRAVLAVLLFSTMPLWAQSVTIGNDVTSPNSSAGNDVSITQTYIDVEHPATATGVLRQAKFYWSQAGCPGGVKLKFFRRSGATLKLFAERGPYDTTANAMSVSLSPTVPVQEGDLIAIVKLTECGNPTALNVPTGGYLKYAGDVGDVAVSAGFATPRRLAVSATGDATQVTARTIPVVGSVAGTFGSFFRTGVQLYNPYTVPLTGRLVFHRAGTNGVAGDPAVDYSLAAGEVKAFPDVIASMGQAGIGSLDVIVDNGSESPQIITRVYNDAGALGTSGFFEDAIDVRNFGRIGNKLLDTGVTGFLITPENPNATRMNIGVRAMGFGATITATLKSSTGVTLRTVTKTYGSNWFEQTTADAFMGMAVGANQTIVFQIDSGTAIIYGSSTDNITNDPAIQFVVGAFAIT